MVGAQRRGCLMDHQFAMRQHVGAMGNSECYLDVLFHQEHGAAAFLGVRGNDRQESLDDHGGEPQRQLVEQQQAWATGQRSTDA